MKRLIMVLCLAAVAAAGISCNSQGYNTTYTVETGDQDMRDVAAKVYGNPDCWSIIANENPGVDPFMLQPGQELTVPPRNSPEANCPAPGWMDIYGY